MKYLETFPWPKGCGIVDVASKPLLAKKFAAYSCSGTIDVVLASAANIREKTLFNNILLGIALKKPSNSKSDETYHQQVVLQHLCASMQNHNAGVLTLLTDLNEYWCFIWFGGRRRILKRTTNLKHAKFLLKNMFNIDVKSICPECFSSRLSWIDCFPETKKLFPEGCMAAMPISDQAT
jgi:hypothetical protein